ncbi:uncharacterized protein C8Q71DRAFT_66143 [Rhodofomes roseus]|uniref:C2H2-type domain-containing protein n=1 Tax=Rhodofomes roseus TaxID=34475 RepID=A0ABQ8KEC9_9APHY|nr:uncharacterized protein C8Q71DRAFT_66143 [Rhodofomes roseus]KAH9836098.1 hypothetical protein C8Q71DRAFT_66143 [Rhodofomes roseus]
MSQQDESRRGRYNRDGTYNPSPPGGSDSNGSGSGGSSGNHRPPATLYLGSQSEGAPSDTSSVHRNTRYYATRIGQDIPVVDQARRPDDLPTPGYSRCPQCSAYYNTSDTRIHGHVCGDHEGRRRRLQPIPGLNESLSPRVGSTPSATTSSSYMTPGSSWHLPSPGSSEPAHTVGSGVSYYSGLHPGGRHSGEGHSSTGSSVSWDPHYPAVQPYGYPVQGHAGGWGSHNPALSLYGQPVPGQQYPHASSIRTTTSAPARYPSHAQGSALSSTSSPSGGSGQQPDTRSHSSWPY